MPVDRMWTNRKGTSLVEILVVMVVLLVGIMTIIQMFPTGFRVVRAAESQTIATRLAQQELERWKNMADNLPTGILAINDTPAHNPINDQVPGPPFVGITQDGPNFVRGNALNVRQIVGETTLIPRGSTFYTGAGAQDGAKYVLAFGPIDATTGPTGLVEGIVVKGGDLRRRTGDYNEAPPRLRAGDYAVDYTLVSQGGNMVFHVAFPKAYGVGNRDYYISYSYLASTDPANPTVEPKVFSMLDQLVPNVAGDEGDWVPVPVVTADLPANYTLVDLEPGSDTCARGFRQVLTTWSDDPYEFRLADAIVGVVAFNPTGHDRFEYTAQGLKPLQARIDYRVNDLRIIREDKVVPEPRGGAGTIPVKLALRFILNIDDPTDNPNEEKYAGLVPGPAGSLSILLPLLVIDLATGLRVKIDTSTDVIDFKAGVVKLPVAADLVTYDPDVPPVTTVPLAGRHLRFYYRADGDWSVQCNKAYQSYAREWGGTPDYRHYVVKPDPNAHDGLSNRLLFAPCEGYKSVVVDYTYITEDATNGRVEHKTVGEAHKIDVPSDASGDSWCIDLGLPDGAYIPTNGRIVVVGTSFTVRVIWRDGKAWRFVEMGTNLTRQ